MKFIKLSNKSNSEIFINPRYISSFFRKHSENYTIVYVVGEMVTPDSYYIVNETPEEILKLIKDSE